MKTRRPRWSRVKAGWSMPFWHLFRSEPGFLYSRYAAASKTFISRFGSRFFTSSSCSPYALSHRPESRDPVSREWPALRWPDRFPRRLLKASRGSAPGRYRAQLRHSPLPYPYAPSRKEFNRRCCPQIRFQETHEPSRRTPRLCQSAACFASWRCLRANRSTQKARAPGSHAKRDPSTCRT